MERHSKIEKLRKERNGIYNARMTSSRSHKIRLHAVKKRYTCILLGLNQSKFYEFLYLTFFSNLTRHLCPNNTIDFMS